MTSNYRKYLAVLLVIKLVLRFWERSLAYSCIFTWFCKARIFVTCKTIPSWLAFAFRPWLIDFMIIITSHVTTRTWYQIDANKKSLIIWLMNSKPFHCNSITAETVSTHMGWFTFFCSYWMAACPICTTRTDKYFQIVRGNALNLELSFAIRKWALIRISNHKNHSHNYIDNHLLHHFVDMVPIHNLNPIFKTLHLSIRTHL